jgi:hypothetical protein
MYSSTNAITPTKYNARPTLLCCHVAIGHPMHVGITFSSIDVAQASLVSTSGRLHRYERAAYQRARRRGSVTSSVALKMALSGWAPCRHYLFNPMMQEVVRTVMLAAQRIEFNAAYILDENGDDNPHVLWLPHDLWCFILRFGKHTDAKPTTPVNTRLCNDIPTALEMTF